MKKTVKDILNFPKYQRTIVLVVFVLLFGGIGAYAMLTGRASGSCTTTVSSVSAAQSAVSSAAAGDTVCMAPGSYGDITLTGSHSSMVTFEPSPVDSSGNALDPNNSAGKVTFSTINVDGNFITAHNFYSTGGIVINNGGSNDVVDHNDVSNTGCGYGVQVYGTQNGNSWTAVANNDVISGNRVHDTGDTTNGCEADAIRIDGYSNLTITGNEVFNIKECPAQNCHTDTLQSYQADVQTSGLTITKNYVHDNTNAQGFPFLKDGDIQDAVIKDNLSLRMTSANQTTGPIIDENSTSSNPTSNPYGVIMENNSYFMSGVIEAIGSAKSPSAEFDHNLFDVINEESGNYTTFVHKYNIYQVLEKDPGMFTYNLDPTETENGQPGYTAPTFKCNASGSTCNSIANTAFACNATCSNLNRAGDDFELASNPNSVGIDWNPANQVYGPQASGGGTTTPPTNTPPNSSVSSPSNGATVSGTVNLTASATATTSGATIKSVQFQVDGKSVGSAITASPYSYGWNTTSVSNGAHTITAIATDSNGLNATSAVVSVTVSNTATTASTNCFASPGSCGYPDPAYKNVGVADCSALKASSSITASTAGQIVQNLNITGDIDIKANNVTVNNVCIKTDGGGQLGSRAITVEKGVTGTAINNSTVYGANTSNQSIESAVVNDYANPNTTASKDYFYNCGECIHGPWTVNDSYVIVNGMANTSDHYEDWYFSDDTISANHDTMFNTYGQTAVVFGDTNGGGGGPGDNHITFTNSLAAGGGYMFYPDGNSSSVGSSTMNISNNRFARCLGKPSFDGSGTTCVGGSDSHGYFPNGGYYGVTAYSYGGNGQTWSGNYWDDNLAIVNQDGSTGTGTGGGVTSPTPTTPGNLHSTAITQNSVSLAWDASTDSGGPGLAGYHIYRGTTLVGTTSGTTFTDTGLTAGTSYSYTVQAYDTSSSGNPSPSTSPLNVTTSPAQQTIAPPQNLNGQAASYSSVSLSWSASSSSNATHYYVVRSDSNNPAATIAILGNVTSYTDNTVLPNTAYSYYIMAGDGSGNYSVASNTVNVTTPNKPNPGPPPTPTNLSGVAISSTQINLSWSAGSPNGDPVAGYNIYRSDKGSQIYAKASGTTWGESGLTPNTSYSYTIEAFDSSGNLSSQAGPVKVTTLSSGTGGTGGFLGTNKIGSQLDSNPQGTAEIFQTKSTTSGTISKVHVWIGWFSNNKDVVIGIYKDVNGRPTSLLTKGASTVLTTKSWNTINVQPISITANQRYWVAILGAGDGVVAFRDVSAGTFNTISASSNLTNLPLQWSPGSSYDNSPLSAYATN